MPKLKLKNSKSVKKRFNISGTGKKQHRHSGINHFNAKQDGSTRRKSRQIKTLARQNNKDVKNLMPYA